MIIFYDKKTGEIIASFEEMYAVPLGFTVSRDGLPTSDFEYKIISPDDAWEFEDPRNPLNIHNFKVSNGKLVDKKNKTRKLKDGLLDEMIFENSLPKNNQSM